MISLQPDMACDFVGKLQTYMLFIRYSSNCVFIADIIDDIYLMFVIILVLFNAAQKFYLRHHGLFVDDEAAKCILSSIVLLGSKEELLANKQATEFR